MAESLQISTGGKEERYALLLQQIRALMIDEPDVIANLANVCAAVKETFGFLWVGFYRVLADQLVLGPFQGPIACTRIRYGRGVCGTAWQQECCLVVDDVDQFPGHIACSSRSRSEIVLPIFIHNEIWGVLDIDSEELSTFDEIDTRNLTLLVGLIEEKL